MTILANAQPFPLFFDKVGVPLSGGSVYFGQPNQNPETAPVTVYWDAAGTQPAPQPLKTVSGYIVRNGTPSLVYINGDYSLTVKAKNGTLLFYVPSAAAFDNSQAIAAQFSLPSGSSNIGFIQPGAGAVSRTVQSKLREFASVTDYGADPIGTADSSAAFQAAIAASRYVFVPAGTYRLSSTVVIPSGTVIAGAGIGATYVNAYGCDAFRVDAGGSFVLICGMGIFSYAAGGAADPRLFNAVYCNGAAGNFVNYVTTRDLYLQGWAGGVNWRYTWNSRADNVTTINTNNGLVLAGQSVNNSVTGSRLIANSGNASISSAQVGSDTPEGLMVSDTLMASGTYGVLTAGSFLSLHISNCVIDLITGDAIRTTDCKGLRVSNSWLYAANACVRLMALGSVVTQGVSIIGNRLQLTGTTGRCIEQNGANVGLNVSGNHFTFGGTATGVYLDGQGGTVDGNYFENTGSGTSIVVNSSTTTHRVGKNAGAATVSGLFGTPEYTEGNWTVTDQSGAGLTITNNSQATYVKNGKQVTVHLDIRFPATANASVARLSLPFQPDAGASPAGCVGFQDINGTFMPSASTAAANFVFWKPGVSGAFATNADVSNARFAITFTYRATS